MFHAIRTRINVTTMVAVLALVFAMTGGAYAAKKYLITSTKQISPSVLKSLQGKSGAAGANGAQGPAGPQGAAGGAGAKGETGPAGKEGSAGKEGPQGNKGATGAKGANGSPWTLGGTLPAKATETGSWSLGMLPEGTEFGYIYVPLSFTMPLPAALDSTHVHFIGEKETAPVGCTGGTVASPTAEPGNLCVYGTVLEHVEFGIIDNPALVEVEGASPTGALLGLKGQAAGEAWGVWAVTGEE